MAQLYNPVTDVFTYYTPTETPKVELDNPLTGITDISDWASRITSSGVPIVKPNTPQTQEFNFDYLNRMAETHQEPSTETYFESSTKTSSNGINTNIKGRPKQAVQFFVDNGYTYNQAMGIVGNLMHESGDPTLNNISNKGDNGSSFGMAQWHDPKKGQGRWTNLKNYAKSIGKSENDFEVQLQFVLKELKDNPYWDKRLKATTTIEGATKQFMLDFENPKKEYSNLKSRINHAKSLSI